MSDSVLVAIVGLVGTLATAAASVLAVYVRNLGQRLGPSNGSTIGDAIEELTAEIRRLHQVLHEHASLDDLRFHQLWMALERSQGNDSGVS